MDENKKQALLKLANPDDLLNMLDAPGRAMRAGIQAYQTDQPVWPSISSQLQPNAPEAPTGAQIAETFGEQHDVQNPYALAGLATLADFVDPTMLVPFGGISKVGKAKAAMKYLPKEINAAKRIASGAEKLASEFGKVKVIPDKIYEPLAHLKADKLIPKDVAEDDKIIRALEEIIRRRNQP